MELESYRAEFNNSVQAAASVGGRYTAEAFVSEVSTRLSEAEEIDTLMPCHHRTTGAKGKHLRVDGFDMSDEDGHLVVAISDYEPGEMMTLGTPEVTRLFSQAQSWVEAALDGRLQQDLEESSQAYEFASDIYDRRDSIFKVRIYLISNNLLSSRLKELPSAEIGGITFEYHPWDIERFMRVAQSALGREEIDIDLRTWLPEGIPVLQAPITSEDVETYLAIVPGDVLAGIYRRYGARVLESNVRSFLSTRGKVNKGIRGTIMQQPEMFLTFNNGITATAGGVTLEEHSGSRNLSGIRDLQIVNGGQTTASIFYVQKDERNIDLSKVFIQMKLTVVDKQVETDLVPMISRFANSQNAVSEADFFSNHAFHRRMEEKSRRILAPTRPGVRYQSRWFYERARGQYLSEKAKLVPSAAKKFEAEFPRAQVITKTDAAKYLMSWEQRPHVVSSGAQKNFLEFAKMIEGRWKVDDAQFGDEYFRAMITKGMLFNSIRQRVMKADWYSSGYLANIVTYTLAKLSQTVSRSGGDLDFSQFWATQGIDDSFLDIVLEMANSVFHVLTDDARPVVNVTEWAKREKCWEQVSALPIIPEGTLSQWMIASSAATETARAQKSDQKLLSGIEAQMHVQALGQRYWYKLRDFARKQKLVTEKELGILRYATGEAGRIPSEMQSQVLMQVEERARGYGFAGN